MFLVVPLAGHCAVRTAKPAPLPVSIRTAAIGQALFHRSVAVPQMARGYSTFFSRLNRQVEFTFRVSSHGSARSLATDDPGQILRRARERINLRVRDVEQASQRISEKYQNPNL
jgi:hypothetical protein